MNNCTGTNCNSGVSCTVSECEHHAKTSDACTLKMIRVGTCCDGDVTSCSGTECASFRS